MAPVGKSAVDLLQKWFFSSIVLQKQKKYLKTHNFAIKSINQDTGDLASACLPCWGNSPEYSLIADWCVVTFQWHLNWFVTCRLASWRAQNITQLLTNTVPGNTIKSEQWKKTIEKIWFFWKEFKKINVGKMKRII